MVRDGENPFAGDLIANGAGVADPQLPVLTVMSRLVVALKMAGRVNLSRSCERSLCCLPGESTLKWPGLVKKFL